MIIPHFHKLKRNKYLNKNSNKALHFIKILKIISFLRNYKINLNISKFDE